MKTEMEKASNIQGHWLLAKMGKKVLRPGGKELTMKLIENLHFSHQDRVIEFAPGLGFTASIVLKKHPFSYTGIELDEKSAQKLKENINGKNQKIIMANANSVPLNEKSADVVYAEAMLTMQSEKNKQNIIREANRLLEKEGRYGIHELAIDDQVANDAMVKEIQKEISNSIKVNARPLLKSEWIKLIESQSFTVEKVMTNPMKLLEPKRVLQDEGFFRTLKIAFNILTHPKERKRILNMRNIFRKYAKYMLGISIIARKKEDTLT